MKSIEDLIKEHEQILKDLEETVKCLLGRSGALRILSSKEYSVPPLNKLPALELKNNWPKQVVYPPLFNRVLSERQNFINEACRPNSDKDLATYNFIVYYAIDDESNEFPYSRYFKSRYDPIIHQNLDKSNKTTKSKIPVKDTVIGKMSSSAIDFIAPLSATVFENYSPIKLTAISSTSSFLSSPLSEKSPVNLEPLVLNPIGQNRTRHLSSTSPQVRIGEQISGSLVATASKNAETKEGSPTKRTLPQLSALHISSSARSSLPQIAANPLQLRSPPRLQPVVNPLQLRSPPPRLQGAANPLQLRSPPPRLQGAANPSQLRSPPPRLQATANPSQLRSLPPRLQAAANPLQVRSLQPRLPAAANLSQLRSPPRLQATANPSQFRSPPPRLQATANPSQFRSPPPPPPHLQATANPSQLRSPPSLQAAANLSQFRSPPPPHLQATANPSQLRSPLSLQAAATLSQSISPLRFEAAEEFPQLRAQLRQQSQVRFSHSMSPSRVQETANLSQSMSPLRFEAVEDFPQFRAQLRQRSTACLSRSLSPPRLIPVPEFLQSVASRRLKATRSLTQLNTPHLQESASPQQSMMPPRQAVASPEKSIMPPPQTAAFLGQSPVSQADVPAQQYLGSDYHINDPPQSLSSSLNITSHNPPPKRKVILESVNEEHFRYEGDPPPPKKRKRGLFRSINPIRFSSPMRVFRRTKKHSLEPVKEDIIKKYLHFDYTYHHQKKLTYREFSQNRLRMMSFHQGKAESLLHKLESHLREIIYLHSILYLGFTDSLEDYKPLVYGILAEEQMAIDFMLLKSYSQHEIQFIREFSQKINSLSDFICDHL